MKEQPSDKARDECGIVGVYNLDPESDQSVTPYIPSALLDLQHRGQLAAGMTRFDPTGAYRLLTHKDTGSVREVFRLTHRAKARSIVDEHAPLHHEPTRLAQVAGHALGDHALVETRPTHGAGGRQGTMAVMARRGPSGARRRCR